MDGCYIVHRMMLMHDEHKNLAEYLKSMSDLSENVKSQLEMF